MIGNMLPITQPNPIETRDRLRSLPRSGPMLQQTIQYLTRAAQGGVPTVEPYIALSELNEIKRDMEKQSSAQATAGAPQSGPLIQTLPQQVKQAAGIAGLQGMRQQQAMQNMMGQAGQQPGPVPEGVEEAAPIQAKAGGLLSLPSARFRSGGIVTFKEPTEENNNSLVTDREEDRDNAEQAVIDAEIGGDTEAAQPTTGVSRETAPVTIGGPVNIDARLADLQGQIQARKNAPAPTLTSRMIGPRAVEEQMIKANPDRYGILATPAGQAQLEQLRKLQAVQAEDIAQRGREIRQPSIGRILMDAAEATRGVKGGLGQISAMLMGAGRSANDQRMQALKEEQALRKEGIGLVEARANAMSKVDELRRAQAKGDIEGEYKARLDLAKIEKDYGISLNNLLGKEYAAVLGYKGKVDVANILGDARVRAAKATAANSRDKEKALERLATARTALVDMTPGTPEYERQLQVIKGLQETVQLGKDVGPSRAFLMLQAMLVNEGKDIRDKMADFAFSPEMQAARLISPEEEMRVANKKLEELRKISRANLETPFPEGGTPAPVKPIQIEPTNTAGTQPGIEAAAKRDFGAYEPAKYEYRINPETGRIQRKLK